MEVNVQFNPYDYKRLQQQLESTYAATGITIQWLCYDQIRLACLDGIKYVAPWADGSPGTGSAQRKQGQGAVEKDLDRLFAKIDKEAYAFWENKKTGEQFAKNKQSQAVFKIDQERWNVTDPKSLHIKNRNARGRVAKQKKQYWIKPSDLKRYTKDVASRVGSLKASWLSALDYFSGKVGGSSRVPSWITKQRREGSFQDAIQPNGNGFVRATNNAHHSIAIRGDTLTYIQKIRQSKIAKYSAKRLQQIADQFNANRTNIQPIRQNAIE